VAASKVAELVGLVALTKPSRRGAKLINRKLS
jgi:hypothetical protein